jgi:hypothetical protein
MDLVIGLDVAKGKTQVGVAQVLQFYKKAQYRQELQHGNLKKGCLYGEELCAPTLQVEQSK